jgi:hypothetical protein
MLPTRRPNKKNARENGNNDEDIDEASTRSNRIHKSTRAFAMTLLLVHEEFFQNTTIHESTSSTSLQSMLSLIMCENCMKYQ